LCLRSWRSLEADHRFPRRLRPQLADPLPHDGVAAGKAAGAQLLLDPHGGHVRVPFQELADEGIVLIQGTRPLRRLRQWRRRHRARPLPQEAVNHLRHRRPGDAQRAGNLPLRRPGLPALDDLVA
jgi:hypothetical protein